MNNMISGLNNETNYAHTENGALVRESTNSSLLDYFSKAGALRNNTQGSVQLFDAAFSESPELAVKAMFYFRDIRGGQGERNNFRAQLLHLAKLSPATVVKNLRNIYEYGRWDDIFVLLDSKQGEEVVALIKNQLLEDVKNAKNGESISLLAKWLPSEKSGKDASKVARKLGKRLKLGVSQYRRIVSTLRESLNIVERKMSRGQWADIDYKTVPSNAMMKYRKAFARHDSVRFADYVDAVNAGETTINSSTLYPYQIVEKCDIDIDIGYGVVADADADLLNAQWNSLPDYVSDATGASENSIAVVDTSGSMLGDPINVAISLGIYLGERATGEYKDHFITFSAQPRLQKIIGTGIVEKVKNLSRANWNANTNLEAVFDLVLKVAIDNKLSQDELIQKIYIISDMQFDTCMRNGDKTMFQHIQRKYESYGYTMPKLVFWNVNARMGNTPMSMDDRGFQNVSGLSPSIFQYLMTGEFKDAYGLMLDVLESDRYAQIVL